MSKARAWLVLGRVSNLSTVWSNCLCAWLLAGGGSLWAFSSLTVGMSLLYVGGMYLNDYCDASFDAKYRPERPIPSGQASRRAVLLATLALFSVGFLLIAWLGGEAAAWGLLLIALIVAYNLVHKKTSLGILLMGGCRLAVYLVAGAAAANGIDDGILWAAGLMFVYVIGITSLARTESTSGSISLLGLAMVAAPAIGAIYLMTDRFEAGGLIAWLALSAWIFWTYTRAKASGQLIVGKMIGPLLAGICLVDWLILSAQLSHSWVASGMFLAFFLVALIAQRRIPAT